MGFCRKVANLRVRITASPEADSLAKNLPVVKAILKGIKRHLKPEIVKFEKGLKKASKDALMLKALEAEFKIPQDKAAQMANLVAVAIKDMALGKNDALHKTVRKAFQAGQQI